MDKAARILRECGGEQLLLDAAAVACFFSIITIVVDSTGQHNAIFGAVAAAADAFVSLKRKAVCLLPAVAVAAGAAYMAYKKGL